MMTLLLTLQFLDFRSKQTVGIEGDVVYHIVVLKATAVYKQQTFHIRHDKNNSSSENIGSKVAVTQSYEVRKTVKFYAMLIIDDQVFHCYGTQYGLHCHKTGWFLYHC